MSKPKAASAPIYAPLPARAMVDRRLSERHLRTLAVVAAHDRFSKNGIGCWASHQRLAAMVGCHYTRISHNLKELGELGYIERVEHPLNKRLRVYRVLYTADDGKAMKAAATDDSCPDGQVSDDQIVAQSDNLDDGIVAQSGNASASIVAHQNQEVADSIEEPPVNIFPEGGNRLRETLERDSAEAASLGSDATSLNIGGQLARFERALKGGAYPDIGIMQQWHDWLEGLHDSLDMSDPNHGRAYRLLEEVDWPEEVYSASMEQGLARWRGEPEVADPTIGASGAARGAMREGASGEAPASRPTPLPDEHSSLAETFPKLYDAFAPCEAPWDPTSGDPEVLARLINADRDQRAEASVVLKRRGREAAAAWVRANLAAKVSAA